MQFRISEGKGINYEQAKKDYIEGLHGVKFRDKHNLGLSAYNRLLKRFREEGITIYNNKLDAKYYYHSKKADVYVVCRRIGVSGKFHYFGNYKTEDEAKARVEELKANNWEGLL